MKIGFEPEAIEQAAISALVQWPGDCFPIVEKSSITEDHFQWPSHRVMFRAAKSLYESGKPLDLILFTNELRVTRSLNQAGGVSYVTETWTVTSHAAESFPYYADILIDNYAKRLAGNLLNETARVLSAPVVEAKNVLPGAVEELLKIPVSYEAPEKTFRELVSEKLERIENGESVCHIPTGIARLDELSPLRNADMPLIVGERKAGKTAFALSIVLNVARLNLPVLYFSLEEPRDKILDRLFAGASRVPLARHHLKFMEPGKALEAATKLSMLPIHVRDDVYDLGRICGITRELKKRHLIGMIVVDYAQLVRATDTKDSNREQKVAEVSRTLRLLAMELKTPLLLISQLNTEGYTRESRALEQDATACWKIEVEESGEASIKIPWQRNGKSGIGFKVTFLGEISRIENYEPS